MYKIIIIGAGLHGCSIFFNLNEQLQKQCLIIDAHEKPCTIFFNRCKKISMQYLRSPASHTLYDPPNDVLFQYANHKFQNNHIPSSTQLFNGRYYTPHIQLFKSFLYNNIKNYSDFPFLQDTVLEIKKSDKSWVIHTVKKTFNTEHVILALGNQIPHIPSDIYLPALSRNHIFHEDFDIKSIPMGSSVAIIGAGMTGTQLALSLKDSHDVHLISSKKIEVSYFDSNPCFIGPKCRNDYINLSNEEKIKTIHEQRKKGTINSYIHGILEDVRKNTKKDIGSNNTLSLYESRVKKIVQRKNLYSLVLQDKTSIPVDHVIFATGLLSSSDIIKHNTLLSNLVESNDLPLTSIGTPLLANNSVEWTPGLFVTGQLGELSIGPTAINIVGALLFSRIMKPIFSAMT